jgi:predicted ATPase
MRFMPTLPEQSPPYVRSPIAPDEATRSLDAFAAAPAVRLFVERAQAVDTDFELNLSNAPAVAAICRRLDGLPLAIELAAARMGLVSPEGLLRRLQRRMPLLTGGVVDLPERQQTLGMTLAWSHDLLGPSQQVLFRRLAVFVGGWTLSAAEVVCAGDDLSTHDLSTHEVLDGLASSRQATRLTICFQAASDTLRRDSVRAHLDPHLLPAGGVSEHAPACR